MTKVDSFLDVLMQKCYTSKRDWSWGWIPTSAGLMYRKTYDCEPANPSRWSGPRHDITLRHSLALIGCPWLLLWRVLPLLHYREAWTPAGKTAPGEHSSHYTHVDGVAVTHTPQKLYSHFLWVCEMYSFRAQITLNARCLCVCVLMLACFHCCLNLLCHQDKLDYTNPLYCLSPVSRLSHSPRAVSPCWKMKSNL